MRRLRTILPAFLFLVGAPAAAQQSASFQLEEHTFNAGGNPNQGAILTSASFRFSLDSLGENAVAIGLADTSFQLDSGFPAAYPPPDEVGSLLFSDATTLVWNIEGSVGSYSLYRDLLSNLSGLGYGSCEQEDIAGETTTDATLPGASDGFFYLVTAENKLAEEGTKGFDSSAAERLGTACP